MITVTKTFMPPRNEFDFILNAAWSSSILANRGPLCQRLEKEIMSSLNSVPLIAMANGTIPIQVAIKSMCDSADEIITTPFSYVATLSSILWEGCVPVFVDIEKNGFNIDPNEIEKAISPRTKCILATHVYGIPCQIERIEEIARKWNLKVIYDGAHAFGVRYKGESIFNFGDVTTCSFHATKIFHTAEGGGFFTGNTLLFEKAMELYNFGQKGAMNFVSVGVNGKISELNAAMGLAVLPYVNSIISMRMKVFDLYLENLNLKDIDVLSIPKNVDWNYSYFPIIFRNEEILVEVKKRLEDLGVLTRRYFYPSLNELSFVGLPSKCERSVELSRRVLCLPMYDGLEITDLKRISETVNDILN
jgi:dTDP-4-amino-4,6-dideoxygalactose transaminase